MNKGHKVADYKCLGKIPTVSLCNRTPRVCQGIQLRSKAPARNKSIFNAFAQKNINFAALPYNFSFLSGVSTTRIAYPPLLAPDIVRHCHNNKARHWHITAIRTHSVLPPNIWEAQERMMFFEGKRGMVCRDSAGKRSQKGEILIQK